MALLNMFTFAATAVYPLGNTSPDNHKVGGWLLHIANASTSPAWSGSALVKGCAAYSGLSGSDLVELPYINVNTQTVEASGTAITAAGLYYIPANGIQVFLDYTSTSGTADVYPIPVEGPFPSPIKPAA